MPLFGVAEGVLDRREEDAKTADVCIHEDFW